LFSSSQRYQAENLSENIRRGDRGSSGEHMGRSADDTFMRGRDDDMTGSQQQLREQREREQDSRGLGGGGGRDDYGGTTGGEYGSTSQRQRQRDTHGAASAGDRDTYDPAQRGTYDSERRKQGGSGGNSGDEYVVGSGTGSQRRDDTYSSQPRQQQQQHGDEGLGTVSGIESGRRDDSAYGNTYAGSGQGQGQHQSGQHKRKDSTFGKLLEKAGGVLGNKTLEERGHQRRESAAGKETSGR
jgi:hypothetical protein